MIPTEKILTNKGKEALFRAIEEYIDAKIAWNILAFCYNGIVKQSEFNEAKKRLDKAKENLENKIMALKIIVEE